MSKVKGCVTYPYTAYKRSKERKARAALQEKQRQEALDVVNFGIAALEDGYTESLINILKIPLAREAFEKYLIATCAEENLTFYMEIQNFKEYQSEMKSQENGYQRIRDKAEEVYKKFVEGGIVNISAIDMDRTWNNIQNLPETTSDMTNCFEEAENAVLGLLALGCLSPFLESEEYEELTEKIGNMSGDKDAPLYQALGDSLLNIRRDLSGESAGWLRQFIGMAELLPFCICLTDMELIDEQVVYVNNKFETVTGYTKEDCVGRNCRFLQGEESEPEAVDEIRASIKEKRPTTVNLTNYRKNGEKFVNFLSMKPLFNAQGNVKYFMSVQFDITQQESQMQIASLCNFFDALPDRL